MLDDGKAAAFDASEQSRTAARIDGANHDRHRQPRRKGVLGPGLKGEFVIIAPISAEHQHAFIDGNDSDEERHCQPSVEASAKEFEKKPVRPFSASGES